MSERTATITPVQEWKYNEIAVGLRQSEPSWALELRKQHVESFLKLPFPKPTDEPWRRTPIMGVKWNAYTPFWDAMANGETVEALIPHEGFQRIHIGQGTQQPNASLFLSSLQRTSTVEGFIVLPIGEALHRVPNLIQPYLVYEPPISLENSIEKIAASVFAYRNAGAFVYIRAGTQQTLPIGIVTTLFTEPSALFTQNVIVLEAGSELTLAEEFVSPPDHRSLLSCSYTKIIVSENAKLHFTGLQNWGLGVTHFGIHHIVLKDSAQAEIIWGGVGSKLSKSRIIIELAGSGAQARIDGFIAAGERQHLDHHTTQHHQAVKTQSNLYFKGVVSDRARSVYQGMIRIDRIAQESDAYQSIKHLTLSPKARVDALPGLEILADNVRCTHGATTRPVDEDEIYYMACRGLPRRAAEELLIEAHIEPILAKIHHPDLQQRCREAVTLKLVGHSLE
ncbi:MAG: Fe-S cluster assembly protein SufD [bacterium]|nr:Fe-S cluster assembly protein SufD [bacterium]